MDIRGMHYDYKQKLNKIDSQQYRNLKVPEIDWKIREAIDLFIKLVAEPKFRNNLGFETTQRVIDDIRTLVVNGEELSLSLYGTDSYVAILPDDYSYYISTDAMFIKKGDCTLRADKIYVRQHDDEFEISPFDKSNFDWREVNITFFEEGIRIYTDGQFTIENFNINYIKQHPLVHNAQDYPGGTYTMTDGTVLTGSQDCILPKHVHSEIVDLAVLLTTVDLQMPDFEAKTVRLGLNQLKQ